MKTKKLKASVLVMSLLIMFAIVIITLSATLISVRDRRISIGSGKSSRAFQIAQSGIEKTLKVIIDLNNDEPVTNIEGQLNSPLNSCNSTNGLLEQDDYTVELKDNNGDKIDCDDISATVGDVHNVKIVGREGATENRAIEAAVAAQVTPGATGGCIIREMSADSWDVLDNTLWGDGCTSGVTGISSTDFYSICEDDVQASGFECGPVGFFTYAGNDHAVCACTDED